MRTPAVAALVLAAAGLLPAACGSDATLPAGRITAHVAGATMRDLVLTGDAGGGLSRSSGRLALRAESGGDALALAAIGYRGPGRYAGENALVDLTLGDSRYSSTSGGTCSLEITRGPATPAALRIATVTGSFTCTGLRPLLAGAGNPVTVDLNEGYFSVPVTQTG